MKKFIQITFILLISFAVQAQDKKAKSLLDQVTAKVKSYNNIVIDFKYSLNNSKENINQDSKGNVTLKDNQYVLNFMRMTKIYDVKKTYTIVPEDEEINISTVNENDDSAVTPSKMLTFFNKGYKYSMDILQNVRGRKIQYVKLIPTNPKDQRKEIWKGKTASATIHSEDRERQRQINVCARLLSIDPLYEKPYAVILDMLCCHFLWPAKYPVCYQHIRRKFSKGLLPI